MPLVRDALRDVAPGTPVSDLRTLDRDVAAGTADTRLTLGLLGMFGLVGLGLAAVGTYSVLACEADP